MGAVTGGCASTSSPTTIRHVPDGVSEPEAVPGHLLNSGQRYDIEVTDCCTDGTRLTGTFERFELFDSAAGGGVRGYRFDIGVFEPEWGPFTFRPVDTGHTT
jgi:hypothetical protein